MYTTAALVGEQPCYITGDEGVPVGSLEGCWVPHH